MRSSLHSEQATVLKARRFVRFPELNNHFGLTWCRMHLDREEKAGRFPKRVKLGPNSVAWLEDEVIAWQAERIAARDRPLTGVSVILSRT